MVLPVSVFTKICMVMRVDRQKYGVGVAREVVWGGWDPTTGERLASEAALISRSLSQRAFLESSLLPTCAASGTVSPVFSSDRTTWRWVFGIGAGVWRVSRAVRSPALRALPSRPFLTMLSHLIPQSSY